MARAGLLLVVALLVGCSQTVVVRTTLPAKGVVIDDVDVGSLAPGEEAEVEVAFGLEPVPWSATVAGQSYSGELERSDLSPLLVGIAVAAAACTLPGCALLGLCAANPQLLATPVLGLICGLGGWAAALEICYGLCAQLCLRPGWLTAPLTCGGGALGTAPLLLAGFRTLPTEITLGPGGVLEDTDVVTPDPAAPPPATRQAQAY